MKTMRAVQITKQGGPLELVDREIPVPKAGQVLLQVEACGVCHGEMVAIEGHHPRMQYPRVPGHEVIGRIVKVSQDVSGFELGQRVGVGWNGGHGEVTGLTQDGGYAEYMVAYADGLARIPEELSSVEAAPLLCAGVTTFGALKNSAERMGDTVAVLGIGGLAAGGEMVVVAGSGEPLDLSAAQFLNGRRSLKGWTAGFAKDSEETIRFSVFTGTHALIEEFPLERAAEAFARMMDSKARFRSVLVMGKH